MLNLATAAKLSAMLDLFGISSCYISEYLKKYWLYWVNSISADHSHKQPKTD